MEGSWLLLAISGLWISFGLLVYFFWRDRRRRQRQDEERAREARLLADEHLGKPAISVKDLEKQFGKKG